MTSAISFIFITLFCGQGPAVGWNLLILVTSTCYSVSGTKSIFVCKLDWMMFPLFILHPWERHFESKNIKSEKQKQKKECYLKVLQSSETSRILSVTLQEKNRGILVPAESQVQNNSLNFGKLKLTPFQLEPRIYTEANSPLWSRGTWKQQCLFNDFEAVVLSIY